MIPIILVWIFVFIVSLVVLLKSSDYFTEAAEKIGIKLGLPQFIIGVTIVAVGTSLPELVSSLFAVSEGASEIVIGNVVGSNIANILLVLGVVAIFAKKIETKYDLLRVDLPIFFASALFLYVTCFDGIFTFGEGIIGIIGIIIYFAFIVNTHRGEKISKEVIKKEKSKLEKEGIFKQVLIILISGVFIFLSAKYVVSSIIQISEILNVAKEIIAITVVALGTSLPELAVCISAARKGNSGMIFGNVLGSNIFNVFAVMGISSFIGAITIPASLIQFSIPFMLGTSLLYFFTIQDKQLTIWEGAILLLFYFLYLSKIFMVF